MAARQKQQQQFEERQMKCGALQDIAHVAVSEGMPEMFDRAETRRAFGAKQPVNASHPLVGTWREREEGDSDSVEYTVEVDGGRFVVTGVDWYDGERFTVSDVSWDGNVLRFNSIMPSTNWRLEHAFRSLSRSQVEHRYTRTETWQRVAKTPRMSGRTRASTRRAKNARA